MTVLRFDDHRGGFAYPFLPRELAWQIVSRPLEQAASANPAAEVAAEAEPTLRWVKDDKVLDLSVPGMDTDVFLAHSGLRLSLAQGGYVLSKRLSRIMRPFRYWGFFAASEVTIDHNSQLDGRLWDGSGQVSRGFIQRLADRLELDDRARRELLHTNRFEVTTLHADGQDKGHVVVVDDPSAGSGQALPVDFMFPAGSAKPELALMDGRVFIGLHPVHSSDQMCLDIQSLINLYPFFRPEHLLAWAGMESALFLDGIRSGRLTGVLNRLSDAHGEADLTALADWHVGEYIASGGSLMWFAGMVQAVAKQHLHRLGSRASKLRCPIPGGRYYIAPAAVGNRTVPAGQVALDPARATAWVNDTDWLTTIVPVLGGCDGDDAVWVFPFTDKGHQRQRRILIWRSPNQAGEYLLLQPTADSHTLAWETVGTPVSYPLLDSRHLPPRMDLRVCAYGELPAAPGDATATAVYSIAAMEPTLAQATANQGVLGAHCNTLMLCQALYGRLPTQLPATLEAVIDGSVKSGLDLTPVRDWNQMALTRMVAHGRQNGQRGLPGVLRERLPEWLREQAQVAGRHWLDTLAQELAAHQGQYWAEVETLATEACPPVELFEHGRDWLAVGKELRQVYGRALRQTFDGRDADTADDLGCDGAEAGFAAARAATTTFLAQWPEAKRPLILLGAAAYLYAQGPQAGVAVRDGLLWQLGAEREGRGREAGVAQAMLAALRQVGLLGEPVWTSAGAVLYYGETPTPRCAGTPVRLNGTWLNWLNSRNGRTYSRMSDVPAAEREQAKARIADFVQEQWRGMMLTTEVTDNGRVVTRTPHGNLFGYVQKDHELAAIRYDQWRIAWATAVDGNVLAVLEPAV
jgi:hypothetical protein